MKTAIILDAIHELYRDYDHYNTILTGDGLFIIANNELFHISVNRITDKEVSLKELRSS